MIISRCRILIKYKLLHNVFTLFLLSRSIRRESIVFMKKFEFEILISLDVLPLQEPKKPNFGTLSVGRSVGLSVARPTAYTVHPILTKFGIYNLRPNTKIGFFNFFDSSQIKAPSPKIRAQTLFPNYLGIY